MSLALLGLTLAGGAALLAEPGQPDQPAGLDKGFLIKPGEIKRRFLRPEGQRALSFSKHRGTFEQWRERCKDKLAELLHVTSPKPRPVRVLRETVHAGVRIQALVMEVSDGLSLPAYLLAPKSGARPDTAVFAIHGHGEVEPCIGERDDYHRQFALKLALEGYRVLCPEHRGFGVLSDLAGDLEDHRLDYWVRGRSRQFTLATDAFQRGLSVIGETIEDFLCWEDWLAGQFPLKTVRVAGISYGGDLAFMYPVFSRRVDRIFASGTLGSFHPIYAHCYNAPAHCIPHILRWMDRADIAGLNAPRRLTLHYGERDTPGRGNTAASYNETVEGAFQELKKIYAAVGAEGQVRLIVSKGKGHEMDIGALVAFMNEP
jgi:dienelactone hydrolase